nr:ATP synthase F0 subunit c [Coptis chinensis]
MLEGAKSIGAGAATIASAGAAVGIGNVLSSLIHSVARNPSFFFELEVGIYFFLLRNKAFFWLLRFITSLLFFLFVFLRIVYPVLGVLETLLSSVSPFFFSSGCPVLATGSDLALLEGYLSLPRQDAGWVEFVRDRLATSPPEELNARIHSFLNIELCGKTKENIYGIFRSIYYTQGDLAPVPPTVIDSSVKYLLLTKNMEFDLPALDSLLASLVYGRELSPVFQEVVEANTSFYNHAWQDQLRQAAQAEQRNAAYLEFLRLEDRLREMIEENHSLFERIEGLQKPPR